MTQTETPTPWKHDITVKRGPSAFEYELRAKCTCGWSYTVARYGADESRFRMKCATDSHKLDMLVKASHLEFNTHETKE